MAIADLFSSTESSERSNPAASGHSDHSSNGSVPLVLDPDFVYPALPEASKVAPFPSIFQDVVELTPVAGKGILEDDLGPASPVSSLVSPFANLEPLHTGPLPKSFLRYPVEPAVAVPKLIPPAREAQVPPVLPESSVAARQELAALQQVLFDVALAVTRRQTELEELESRARKAQETIDESAAGQKELAAWRDELKSVMEKANAEHDQLQASLGEVRSTHQSLSGEVEDLSVKRTELEEKIFLLQSTAGELEAGIMEKTGRSETLAKDLASLTTTFAELQENLHRQETEKSETLVKLMGESDLASAALQRLKESLCNNVLENEALARTRDGHQASVIGLEERRKQLLAETDQMQASLEQHTAAVRALEERAEQFTKNLAEAEKESIEKETALVLRFGQLENAATEAQATLAAAESALALVQSRHEALEKEHHAFGASHEAVRERHTSLQTGVEDLQKSFAEKTTTLARLDRELMQTRRELDELKRNSDRTESELLARRKALEAEVETSTATHERLQQTLAATQARRDGLLVKQDEALEELDRRQQNLMALIKEEEAARLALQRTSAELEALTGRLKDRTQQADGMVPGSEQHFASLAAMEDKTNAAEALLRKKTAEQEAVDLALRAAQSELAAFRQTALSEHQQWGARREQMEAEFAAAAATIEASRKAALDEQARHQEVANRQTTALNELDGTTAQLEALKVEAMELQSVVNERISQKETLLDEIARVGQKLDNLTSGSPEEIINTKVEESLERVIMDLIRLVDATDTSSAYAEKRDGESVKGQFFLLRQAITTTLKNLQVDEFTPVPGTPVDSNVRRQILVAKQLNGNAPPYIKSVISPGFVKGKGYSHERFLRKPEVVISSEESASA